jgi:hypothetical protein
MKKRLSSLLFIAIVLVQSAYTQVIDYRVRQRNDQKVEIEWFFKGDSTTTSVERKERDENGVDVTSYEVIANINLHDEIFIDDFNFTGAQYVYRIYHNGEAFEKKAVINDFSTFALLPPSDVVYYKSDGDIYLYWTDITHREDEYLIFDQDSNLLLTAGINQTHVVFADQGWSEIYVAAKGDGIETAKVLASQIAVIDFDTVLTQEDPLVTVCPNVKFINGVANNDYVNENVSGLIDFLIQDEDLRYRIDVVKLYSQVHFLEDSTLQKLVDFQNDYDKMIAIETGGIRQKNGVDKTQVGEYQGEHTYTYHITPILNAGGTVHFIETDNAGLFGVWGGNEPDPSITDPLNLTTSEIAKELADYFDYIYQRSPEIKFGIIENLKGWNFGEWKGAKSPVGGSQAGIEDILTQLNVQMRRKGITLNHFTAELPWQEAEDFGFDDYNYRKMDGVAEFCAGLGIKFSKLYNPNSQTASDEEFFNFTTQFYTKVKDVCEFNTYADIFQSWIAYPSTIYGDEDPYSFTNIVKTLIQGPTSDIIFSLTDGTNPIAGATIVLDNEVLASDSTGQIVFAKEAGTYSFTVDAGENGQTKGEVTVDGATDVSFPITLDGSYFYDFDEPLAEDFLITFDYQGNKAWSELTLQSPLNPAPDGLKPFRMVFGDTDIRVFNAEYPTGSGISGFPCTKDTLYNFRLYMMTADTTYSLYYKKESESSWDTIIENSSWKEYTSPIGRLKVAINGGLLRGDATNINVGKAITFSLTDGVDPIKDAMIVLDNQTLSSDSTGQVVFARAPGTYTFTVDAGENGQTKGEVTVDSTDVFFPITLDGSYYYDFDEPLSEDFLISFDYKGILAWSELTLQSPLSATPNGLKPFRMVFGNNDIWIFNAENPSGTGINGFPYERGIVYNYELYMYVNSNT